MGDPFYDPVGEFDRPRKASSRDWRADHFKVYADFNPTRYPIVVEAIDTRTGNLVKLPMTPAAARILRHDLQSALVTIGEN